MIRISSLWTNLRQAFRNLKLNRKLSISFTILVLIPLISFGIAAYRSNQQTTAVAAEKSMTDTVGQMREKVENQINLYQSILEFIGFNKELSAAFQYKGTSYYQQYYDMNYTLEPMLLTMKQLSRDIKAIGIYTPNEWFHERGSSLLHMSRIVDEPWYDEVMSDYNVHWEIVNGRLTGLRHMVHTGGSFSDCIVYCSIDINNLFSIEMNSLKSFGLVIKNQNEIIYDYHVNISEYNEVSQNNLQNGVHKINGTNIFVMNQTINATGWQICFYCPYSEIAKGDRNMAFTMILLTLLSILFLVLFIFLIGKSLSARIRHLNESMHQVESGNLNIVVDTIHADEIGELTLHFGKMLAAMRDHIQTEYQNKIVMREAELRSLQSQINPHFLYNTLSMINWKAIDIDAYEISEITRNLSNFYRSVLNKGKSESTVKEELINAECYLDIQSRLHDNSFEVTIAIDQELMDKYMLGIILQPLLENAIEHGIDQRREPGGKIKIEGFTDGQTICFAISDNGPGLSESMLQENLSKESNGYGLKNVNDRLRIAYGECYGLSLDAAFTEGTRIIVTMPGST